MRTLVTLACTSASAVTTRPRRTSRTILIVSSSRSIASGVVTTRCIKKLDSDQRFARHRPVAPIGRAAVSKTACWGFESLLACQLLSSARLLMSSLKTGCLFGVIDGYDSRFRKQMAKKSKTQRAARAARKEQARRKPRKSVVNAEADAAEEEPKKKGFLAKKEARSRKKKSRESLQDREESRRKRQAAKKRRFQFFSRMSVQS